MKTRRAEEAITAAGHRERHICGGRVFRSGAGGQRADAGAQITGCRVTSRPQPQLKRPLFVAEGRKIDLLRHQVTSQSLSPLAASYMKTITERSMFRSVASIVTLVRPSFRFASQKDDG